MSEEDKKPNFTQERAARKSCSFAYMKDIYKTSKWAKLRQQALRRDGYICQNCKRYGRVRPATTVHHKKHADEYPELFYDIDNLESLCTACHNKEHPEKAKNYRY